MDEELRRYDEYMEHARGLAPKTRSMALRIIGRLLTECFGSDAINIATITPEQVRQFFAQEALRYSKPSSLASVVASLRGYFRYHVSLGDHVHGGLTSAMAYPANWKQSALPKTLTTEEVAQLVNALGRPGPSMRRADAIVRCAHTHMHRQGSTHNGCEWGNSHKHTRRMLLATDAREQVSTDRVRLRLGRSPHKNCKIDPAHLR